MKKTEMAKKGASKQSAKAKVTKPKPKPKMAVKKAPVKPKVIEPKVIVKGKGKSDYETIRQEVEKPTIKRTQVETRRGNMRIPRRYHLTKVKMDKLIAATQASGDFPNPYRKGGIYHALVQSLVDLGSNQKHTFKEVLKQTEKVLRQYETKDKVNAWEAFASRTPRNELSGKDVPGRVLQNAMVLQRLTGYHLYGEKLRQLCACIDIFVEHSFPVLRLNTKFAVSSDVAPINEMRRTRGSISNVVKAVKRSKVVKPLPDTAPVVTVTPVQEPVPVVEQNPAKIEIMPDIQEPVHTPADE